MRVLVVNCGSSSLKIDLIDTGAGRDDRFRLATGAAEQIGQDTSLVSLRVGADTPSHQHATLRDHAAGIRALCGLLRDHGLFPGGIDAVAHRIVHGGAHHEPAVLDDEVLRGLRDASALAPLHNHVALAAADAMRREVGEDVTIGVFDTAFHHDLPPHAAAYALPFDLATRHGIRRYGFHGIAHRYMSERWAELSSSAHAASRLVTFQLGNGCSASAIRGGRTRDTSMGFTPLEGLVMGTRCGDIDPSIPAFLAERENLDLDQVDALLNQRSGLLGVAGTSDMKALLDARDRGDARARLAIDMFTHRARKYLGAYLAVLDGADAVIFGGGIGERAPQLREEICHDMHWCGLELDATRNAAPGDHDRRISTDSSAIELWVIAVDEASIIARDCAAVAARTAMQPGRTRA